MTNERQDTKRESFLKNLPLFTPTTPHHTPPPTTLHCSQKWSLNRTTRRVPKLPMAKHTARILQKGVIYEPIDHIAK